MIEKTAMRAVIAGAEDHRSGQDGFAVRDPG